jgi:hypothetical protein
VRHTTRSFGQTKVLPRLWTCDDGDVDLAGAARDGDTSVIAAHAGEGRTEAAARLTLEIL